MFGDSNLKVWRPGLVLGLVLAGTTLALAGGFWISLYSPKAPVAANIPDAAAVVAVEGCHNPADAVMTGTAEGLVGGKRQSVSLKFTPTSKPGVYVVKRQWPVEGVWVLSITAKNMGLSTTAMVEVGPNGQAKSFPSKVYSKSVSPSEVEAALQRMAGKTT